jgi:hypothetical protein
MKNISPIIEKQLNYFEYIVVPSIIEYDNRFGKKLIAISTEQFNKLNYYDLFWEYIAFYKKNWNLNDQSLNVGFDIEIYSDDKIYLFLVCRFPKVILRFHTGEEGVLNKLGIEKWKNLVKSKNIIENANITNIPKYDLVNEIGDCIKPKLIRYFVNKEDYKAKNWAQISWFCWEQQKLVIVQEDFNIEKDYLIKKNCLLEQTRLIEQACLIESGPVFEQLTGFSQNILHNELDFKITNYKRFIWLVSEYVKNEQQWRSREISQNELNFWILYLEYIKWTKTIWRLKDKQFNNWTMRKKIYPFLSYRFPKIIVRFKNEDEKFLNEMELTGDKIWMKLIKSQNIGEDENIKALINNGKIFNIYRNNHTPITVTTYLVPENQFKIENWKQVFWFWWHQRRLVILYNEFSSLESCENLVYSYVTKLTGCTTITINYLYDQKNHK